MGLLVTAENGDAKAWYERAGFAMTHENWRLKVSAAAEDANGDEATAKHARPRAQRMLSSPGTVRRWLEISGGAALREAASRSYDELVAAHGSVRACVQHGGSAIHGPPGLAAEAAPSPSDAF